MLEPIPPTDSLDKIQAKMQEYIKSGMRLGWLIDVDNRTVKVYRINQSVEVLRLFPANRLPGCVAKTL